MIELNGGRVLDIQDAGGNGAGPALPPRHAGLGDAADHTMVEAAERARLRLVTYARAGYGASSRHPGRSVADVVTDMEQVLDHLGVDRCVTGRLVRRRAACAGHGRPAPGADGGVARDRRRGAVRAPTGWTSSRAWASSNVEEFGLALEGEDALRPYLEARPPTSGTPTARASSRRFDTCCPTSTAPCSPTSSATGWPRTREGLRPGIDGWLDDDLAFTAAVGLRPRGDHGADHRSGRATRT